MKTRKYIKPRRSKYIEDSTKKIKRMITVFFMAVIIVIMTITLLIQLNKKLSSSSDSSTNQATKTTQKDIPTTRQEASTPSTKPKEPEPKKTRPSSAEGPYSVTYVVDGDTIHINYHGTETSLRLIGVNTPETVDQRTTVQCFGKEASDYLKTKLTGKQVYIERDPTQSDYDDYGRLLRYVYLDDEDVALSIIANGYGHEYTYYIPYQKQSEYKSAEKNAATNNLGLWSPNTCGGVTR